MLDILGIQKDYDGKPLLRGVSFKVNQGETVCLLGPSGSGKSTLLRIIAGLERPEHGRILWDGEDLENVPVHQRNFGLMFQDYALFPHKNVFENVAFGLRMQKLPQEQILKRGQHALRQVKMQALAERKVGDLSGGEQQRVAFARTLAPRPKMIMLDEPLGALDRNLRVKLMQDLRQMLRSLKIPAIYVTHDQEEALFMSDRLVILKNGRIIQQGAPADVYRHPATEWTARFLGIDNIASAEVESIAPLVVVTDFGKFQLSPAVGKFKAKQRIKIFLTNDCARITRFTRPLNCMRGIVKDCTFNITHYRWRVRTAGRQEFHLNLPAAARIGEEYLFRIAREGIGWLIE